MDLAQDDGNWLQRALCRWLAYLILWIAACTCCLLSDFHGVLRLSGLLLGCLLAASLPLFSTSLFGLAYSRRANSDLPFLVCPWLAAFGALIGSFALLQASPVIRWDYSHAKVGSARELCSLFEDVPIEELPSTVCIRHAFIKTGAEAGKDECKDIEGEVICQPSYMAAPIFENHAEAEEGQPDKIWAWAVMHGRHVNANYEFDGSLCGYLSSHAHTASMVGLFQLAVEGAISLQNMSLTEHVYDEGPCAHVPLKLRPLVLTSDLEMYTLALQAWMAIGFVILFCCPCIGPVPLAIILVYAHWQAKDEYADRQLVMPDDYEG
eukprot:TRINITY_DN60456_c0_g1_i1.p1 TRINITY_DN60456_c0_g1~~TRINITY_DN60456_c0_g1_i1.p1  ORF type:complete len:342 (+),score=32.69 TRINITY_DN60456_c0_g1_i1:62-1027(+)